MANMKIEAKRVKAGASLTAYEVTALNAINQLKAIKQQLVDLKAAVGNDPDYTQDDVNVVQEVINNLLAELDTL